MKKYTRTEVRTRRVPHTVDGETRMVPDEYEAEVFAPPRDWDTIALVAIGTATAVVSAVSIAWSTVSVGTLLAVAVPFPAVAYLVSGVFDLGWMTCNAAEWRARNDPRKACLPRNLGHVALAVAVLAIFADGFRAGSWAVGSVGAAVSLIAKGLWILTMHQVTRPLDTLTQRWLDQADDEAAAKLATIERLKKIRRAEHRAAAEAAALSIQAPPLPIAAAQPGPDTTGTPDPRPAVEPRTPALAAQPVDPAVLYAFGIQLDPDTVRALQGSDDAEDEQPPAPPGTAKVRPMSAPGHSARDTTKIAVASGIRDRDEVIAYVQSVHGPDTKPETIDRYRRAFLKTAV